MCNTTLVDGEEKNIIYNLFVSVCIETQGLLHECTHNIMMYVHVLKPYIFKK